VPGSGGSEQGEEQGKAKPPEQPPEQPSAEAEETRLWKQSLQDFKEATGILVETIKMLQGLGDPETARAVLEALPKIMQSIKAEKPTTTAPPPPPPSQPPPPQPPQALCCVCFL